MKYHWTGRALAIGLVPGVVYPRTYGRTLHELVTAALAYLAVPEEREQ